MLLSALMFGVFMRKLSIITERTQCRWRKPKLSLCKCRKWIFELTGSNNKQSRCAIATVKLLSVGMWHEHISFTYLFVTHKKKMFDDETFKFSVNVMKKNNTKKTLDDVTAQNVNIFVQFTPFGTHSNNTQDFCVLLCLSFETQMIWTFFFSLGLEGHWIICWNI